MRTLEERLKFDHQLTIGHVYPVALSVGMYPVGHCTVRIPNRGYPRLAVLSKCGSFLKVYKVRGNELIFDGQQWVNETEKADWLALFTNPTRIEHK